MTEPNSAGGVGDGGSGVNDGQVNGADGTTPEPMYSSADLDKYKGAARKEGRNAALNELLEATGAASREEVIAAVQEKRAIEEATRTETEREKEARLQAEKERDQFRTLADTRLIDSELRIALLNAGVPSDRIAAAAKLVERDGIAVNGNAVEGLEEAVTQTIEGMPWLLGDSGAQQQTFRAADTTPQPQATSAEPEQKMGSWINQLLSQP